MGISAGQWVAVAGGIIFGVGLGNSPATQAIVPEVTTNVDAAHITPVWSPNWDPAPWSSPVSPSHPAPSALAQFSPSSRSLYEQGRYPEALAALEQEIARLAPRSMERAAALGNLALLQDRLGQPAIATVNQALSLSNDLGDRSHVTADLLSLRGQLTLNQGQAEAALRNWEAAEARYSQLNRSSDITRSRIAQAQALQRLGFYRRALQKLREMSDRLQSQPDDAEKVI